MSSISSGHEGSNEEISDSTLALPTVEKTKRSLSVLVTAIYIVGSICGGGILAIPQATVACGIIATVFILLVAGNISELIYELSGKETKFSLCYLLMITVAVLLPFTYLGTPKDFWQAAVIAAVTSILAAIFVFASLLTSEKKSVRHSSPEWSGFFSAFGTILFAFGGASAFPTIQVDMTEPQRFPTSVVMALFSVLGVYLLVGVSGYAIVGDDITPNIVNALQAGWMAYAVNILITIHLLMASVIITNPVTQGIEGFFGVPDRLSLGRILVRTGTYLFSLFIALSVPHFNIILSLLGGSTIALTNFIFPPLFYYLLSKQREPSDAYGELPEETQKDEPSTTSHIQETSHWVREEIPLHVKIMLLEIILIGVVGGVSSTYFSFASLISGDSAFTVPCYVNISVGFPS